MVSYNLGTLEFKKEHIATNLKNRIKQVMVKCEILSGPTAIALAPTVVVMVAIDEGSQNSELDYGVDEDIESDVSDSEDELLSSEIVEVPEGVKVYITTDNAKNISKAVEESKFSHIRCFAHSVNLAVQKGLKVSHISLSAGQDTKSGKIRW